MNSTEKLARLGFVFGLLSAVSLIVQYLALSDIARSPASKVEWYIVGVCMIVTAVFVVTSLLVLRRLVFPRPNMPSPTSSRQADSASSRQADSTGSRQADSTRSRQADSTGSRQA